MNAPTVLRFAAASVLALAAGCAAPPAPSVEPLGALFHDELFAPPSTPVDPGAALAPSPAMLARLNALRKARRWDDDPRRMLLEALAGPGDDRLHLDYDAAMTRTAAEAFSARRGNCLSLVLMTAAFAHELGVPIRFQAVEGVDEWAHAGGLAVSVGHVNVAVDPPVAVHGWRREPGEAMVIDFLPSKQAERLRTRRIEERTVVAMYLNNRAVEALADGRLDDAYAWARAAAEQDPAHDAALLTLAVVYRQRHRPEHAAAALQRVLDRDPGQANALADLAFVLRDLGRDAEADAIERQAVSRGGGPPFSAFDAGIAAYREGRYVAARERFAEALRSPTAAGGGVSDTEFWLARTLARLGNLDAARGHLDLALAAGGDAPDAARYAAKLARLRALATGPSP